MDSLTPRMSATEADQMSRAARPAAVALSEGRFALDDDKGINGLHGILGPAYSTNFRPEPV